MWTRLGVRHEICGKENSHRNSLGPWKICGKAMVTVRAVQVRNRKVGRQDCFFRNGDSSWIVECHRYSVTGMSRKGFLGSHVRCRNRRIYSSREPDHRTDLKRTNTNYLNQEQRRQRSEDIAIIYGSSLVLFTLTVLAVRFGGVFTDVNSVGDVSVGDIAGAVLWGISLYYVSPIQLLLLFLGRIETERPSDWLLRRLGLASGLDVDAIDYVAPLPLRMGVLAICAASGGIVSLALEAMLGDATWAISTGIGSLFAAGLYEVGRPERLSVSELKELEKQWSDFKEFADEALVRSGRCHETEIFKNFRRRSGKYRTQEQLSDVRIRQMIKNWWPKVERSSSGWYKNISVATPEQLLSGNWSDGT